MFSKANRYPNPKNQQHAGKQNADAVWKLRIVAIEFMGWAFVSHDLIHRLRTAIGRQALRAQRRSEALSLARDRNEDHGTAFLVGIVRGKSLDIVGRQDARHRRHLRTLAGAGLIGA